MNIFQLLFLTLSFLDFGTESSPEIHSSTTTYVEIIKVELKHEYFEDGKLKGFQIEPDRATATMLRQYGLKIRYTENFMRIFAPDTLNLSEVVFDRDFRFNCTGDPDFYNYTGDYNYSFDPNKDRLTFLNESQDGSPIELISEIFGAPENETYKKIAFSIWLDFNDLKLESLEHPIHYLIQFKSRQVSIKYYFITKESHDMQIRDIQPIGKMADLFKFNDASTKMANGDKAYVLDSGSNLFPLKERCENLSADIAFYRSGEPLSLTLTLPPCPDTRRVLYDEQAQHYYVEVYIYL
jgi:hypothetical protein